MKDIKNLRAAALPVIILGSILLLGAIVFYEQRMLFLDPSHILFEIINTGALQIQERRYGSFITQMVPLFGVKLHLSLNTLLILYSISFNLFFLITILLLIKKYKRYDLAILFGFYLTLFVSDTYFWTNNEVHQGIAWLMLAFGITFFAAEKRRPEIMLFLLFITFFTLGIWTHPLVMFVAVYLWFFYWMRGEEWPFTKIQSVCYSIILLIIVWLKFNKSLHHGYDSDKMEAVSHIKIQSILHLNTSPQFRFFIANGITHYWLLTALFIIGMAALLKARKYIYFIWTLLFVSGYCIVLCITYWDLNSLRFYIESEYMPLAIIATVPFVYYVLPFLSKRSIVFSLFFIFLVRLLYIGHSSTIFINRMRFNENIVNKMREKNYYKVIIPTNPVIDSTLIMSWGGPTESMIISSLQHDSPLRTFIFVNPNDVAQYSNTGKDIYIACFNKQSYSSLNSYYFRIDTINNYQVIEYAQLMN